MYDSIEFHEAEEWTAVYLNGKLERVGDSYLADEWLQGYVGVKLVQDDAFLRGGNSREDVAKTLQPHWMSMRKSKEWWVLAQHALRITAGGLAVAIGILIVKHGAGDWSSRGAVWWALLNGGAHFAIDAVTSRITSKLWSRGDAHNFFVVIGFDQFLHVSLALGTLAWLVT